MPERIDAVSAIKAQKMLPLFYHDDREVSLKTVEALYRAGVRVVEYTNRGEKAFSNFEYLKKKSAGLFPGLLLGIGTIKTAQDARSFIGIGADYIICPSLNAEVASVTHQAKLQWIPGCMTTTEIANAELAGATLVKLFPGSLLGPGYVSAIRDIFPNLSFMPTGGVEAEESNLQAWFKAGVCAVGMGSKLVSKELLEKRAYGEIKERTEEAMRLVRLIQTT